MPVILTHAVKLFDGFPPGAGLVTINDDNTFSLTKLDKTTNQPTATVISTPMSELTVRGRATRLTFITSAIRRSVDFSLSSELISGYGGIVGDIAGGALAGKSGVKEVVEALRKGGATVHYLTYWQRRALNWAIAIGVLVVVVLIFIVAALAQH